MNQSLLWSVGMVTLAGILQGIFAAPVKRLPAWRWQSHWLLFALSGLIIFPWIVTFATVPNVTSVYAGVSPYTLIKVLLIGGLWGACATLLCRANGRGSVVGPRSTNWAGVGVSLAAVAAISGGNGI